MTELSGVLQGQALSGLQSPGGGSSALLPPGVVSPVKPTAGLMLEDKKICQYSKSDVVHLFLYNFAMALTISVST